jgi:membrane protease YdiL (CAAX protease family)
MAISNPAELFQTPKFRHVLGLVGAIWLGLTILIITSLVYGNLSLNLTDPVVTPLSYLIMFGGCSGWIVWQYRRRQIDLQSILGMWPRPIHWQRLIGLWLLLFLFSLGSFQISFVALSYAFPGFVQERLQDSIFLGPQDTPLSALYNGLVVFVLVVAAPVLEEFLFRGFLLHRWGGRWNTKTAVILSSVLFGVLHSNAIGLTMFGIVMALLYLRYQSLRVVIAVHSLNNAVAAGLEILARLTGVSTAPTLDEFRTSFWVGLVLFAIATPLLIRFLQRNWSLTRGPLPYITNQKRLARS